MIVILQQNPGPQKVQRLLQNLEGMGLSHHYSQGTENTIVGIIGDTSKVDIDLVRANDIVQDVKRVSEPYKAANRKFHPEDTVVGAGEGLLGGRHFGVIAGPCSVETEDQILSVARDVKRSGAKFLRGGAFRPRTSPYAFQGLHAEGL